MLNPDRTLKCRLIVFDMDGVLVNSIDVMKMAFSAALRECRSDLQLHDCERLFSIYRQHLGKGFLQIMAELGLPETLHEPFKKHSRYLAPYVAVYPGVEALLSSLKEQGIRLTVATGKDGNRARELLERLQLAEYFDEVTGSDQAAPKPAPDVINFHRAKFDVARQETLMVGDSPVDLLCARSAGVHSAAALWGYSNYRILESCLPDYLFSAPYSMTEKIQGC